MNITQDMQQINQEIKQNIINIRTLLENHRKLIKEKQRIVQNYLEQQSQKRSGNLNTSQIVNNLSQMQVNDPDLQNIISILPAMEIIPQLLNFEKLRLSPSLDQEHNLFKQQDLYLVQQLDQLDVQYENAKKQKGDLSEQIKIKIQELDQIELKIQIQMRQHSDLSTEKIDTSKDIYQVQLKIESELKQQITAREEIRKKMIQIIATMINILKQLLNHRNNRHQTLNSSINLGNNNLPMQNQQNYLINMYKKLKDADQIPQLVQKIEQKDKLYKENLNKIIDESQELGQSLLQQLEKEAAQMNDFEQYADNKSISDQVIQSYRQLTNTHPNSPVDLQETHNHNMKLQEILKHFIEDVVNLENNLKPPKDRCDYLENEQNLLQNEQNVRNNFIKQLDQFQTYIAKLDSQLTELGQNLTNLQIKMNDELEKRENAITLVDTQLYNNQQEVIRDLENKRKNLEKKKTELQNEQQNNIQDVSNKFIELYQGSKDHLEEIIPSKELEEYKKVSNSKSFNQLRLQIIKANKRLTNLLLKNNQGLIQ